MNELDGRFLFLFIIISFCIIKILFWTIQTHIKIHRLESQLGKPTIDWIIYTYHPESDIDWVRRKLALIQFYRISYLRRFIFVLTKKYYNLILNHIKINSQISYNFLFKEYL